RAPAALFLSEDTEQLAVYLHNSFSYPYLCQPGRFHDTLARYYFRLAALEKHGSLEKASKLAQAQLHNKKSLKARQDKGLYDTLKQELDKVKTKEWFKKATPYQG
ncbi:MAG: hypothetical protein AAFZ52_18685, partial [Bacteroidota bacterium]